MKCCGCWAANTSWQCKAFSSAYSFRSYVISHGDITPLPLLNDKLDYVYRVTANYSSTIREPFDFVLVHTSALRGTKKCGHAAIYHREKPRRDNIYRVTVFFVFVIVVVVVVVGRRLVVSFVLQEHTRGTRSSPTSRSCTIKRALLVQTSSSRPQKVVSLDSTHCGRKISKK